METEIKKRKFEAEKYPKDSLERKKLNENQITSEYYHSRKYVAFIHLPATATRTFVTHNRSFDTKTKAQQWIDDNKNRIETDHGMTIEEYMRKNL